MISDPSPGDSVFVIQITGKVTAAVITDLKPIEGLSCVGGEFPDADKEALIPLDACYTTESEALGYAVENAEFLLDSLRNAVNLNSRWLRVPSAVKYSGLSRSLLTPEARSSLSQAR